MKLKKKKVRKIKKMIKKGKAVSKISKKLEVSRSAIYDIKSGKTHKNIK